MPAVSDERILVLMPTMKDGMRTGRVLTAAGLTYQVCDNLLDLCHHINAGAAVALLTEESLEADEGEQLQLVLRKQPPWSDFPLVVLAREHERHQRTQESMNIMLVERPARMRSLLSVIRAALRSRRHQYEVRDHLIERKRAEDALKQADRRKDEFLAMLAHELRNPLAPLRSSVDIMQRTAAQDPVNAKLCQTMDRQVNHLVRLVDDLLEVSRITRGKIDLRKEIVDLATVARSAIETSRPLIDAAGLQLTVALPSEPIAINGDPVRLAQVFANLLNNSAKYNQVGGQIWLSALRDGDEAVVSVRDNGIGIAAEMLPKVFDMFMQVDRATNRAQGGLGIGLTLVRSLVELHHGSVAVCSGGPDRGSEFVVRLPIAVDGRRAAEPRTSSAPRQQLTLRRVLVVDDNVDAATTLGALLRVLGAEIHIAHDGPSALQTIEACRPEIVLLDIGMPGMDGFEVAERIRRNPQLADLVLIALTGWGQEDDRRRTRVAGFDHHLVKPVNLEALQQLLATSEA